VFPLSLDFDSAEIYRLVLDPVITVTYFRFAEMVTRGAWPDLFA